MLYMSLPPPECKVLFREAEASLPQPLPSIETIEATPGFTDEFPSFIVYIGNHFLVKYGTAVEPLEAENMMFVRQHAKLCVPRVFGVYQRQVSPCEAITYMIMERLEGKGLDMTWNDPGRRTKGSSLPSSQRLLHFSAGCTAQGILWEPI
ncbi:hypothetical protein PWT90_03983 [Aphanocladium album]|nr:hypothetical protein PWT90_03983 [Aphanocladium album]